MRDFDWDKLGTFLFIAILFIFYLGGQIYWLTSMAKGSEPRITKQMEQLEKLYDDLYGFHQSSGFIKFGYSAAGRGDWSDEVRIISKDKKLKTYIKSLVPEKLETEFLFLRPLEPIHLWFLGRYYMNNSGQENKDTLTIKAQFQKLFKLHKSRNK